MGMRAEVCNQRLESIELINNSPARLVLERQPTQDSELPWRCGPPQKQPHRSDTHSFQSQGSAPNRPAVILATSTVDPSLQYSYF